MNEKENKNKMPRFNMNWIYGIIVLVLAYMFFTGTGDSSSKTIDYTRFEKYVRSGYATRIVAQKDKGVLQMYVTKEHLKDVFNTNDLSKIGGAPAVTVEYADKKPVLPVAGRKSSYRFRANGI